MCLLKQSVVSAFVVDSNVYGRGRDAEVAAREARARKGGGDAEGSEEPASAVVVAIFDEGAVICLVVGSGGVLLVGDGAVNGRWETEGNVITGYGAHCRRS